MMKLAAKAMAVVTCIGSSLCITAGAVAIITPDAPEDAIMQPLRIGVILVVAAVACLALIGKRGNG